MAQYTSNSVTLSLSISSSGTSDTESAPILPMRISSLNNEVRTNNKTFSQQAMIEKPPVKLEKIPINLCEPPEKKIPRKNSKIFHSNRLSTPISTSTSTSQVNFKKSSSSSPTSSPTATSPTLSPTSPRKNQHKSLSSHIKKYLNLDNSPIILVTTINSDNDDKINTCLKYMPSKISIPELSNSGLDIITDGITTHESHDVIEYKPTNLIKNISIDPNSKLFFALTTINKNNIICIINIENNKYTGYILSQSPTIKFYLDNCNPTTCHENLLHILGSTFTNYSEFKKMKMSESLITGINKFNDERTFFPSYMEIGILYKKKNQKLEGILNNKYFETRSDL